MANCWTTVDLYGGRLKGQWHGLTSLFLLGRPKPDGLSTKRMLLCSLPRECAETVLGSRQHCKAPMQSRALSSIQCLPRWLDPKQLF